MSEGTDNDTDERGGVVGDRYVLKSHLGSGRYGEVYVAVDRSLSDPQIRLENLVVLHLLHPEVARQTRLLQKLEASYHEPHLWSHPNVVKVRGFGCDQGRYFLVTELLDGVTLRALLDETSRLPADDDSLAVLRGVGDALTYAHAKGAIHGDIRPAKIFATSDRSIKVLDLLPASSPRTRAFFVEDVGPGGIAAPDPRDDVYGFACIAYELWSRRHPFEGRSPLEALNAGLLAPPITSLGTERWNALARGLELRREFRTASIAELVGALGIAKREAQRPSLAVERGAPATSRDALPAVESALTSEPEVRAHRSDDDMPIIGDFSDRNDFSARRPDPPMTAPPRPRPAAAESWQVDPRDVHRYADRTRRKPRGPLAKLVRVAAVLIAAGVIGLAVYWNYDSLKTIEIEWPGFGRTASSDASGGRAPTPPREGETVVVEPPAVVGTPDVPAGRDAPPPPQAAPPAAELPLATVAAPEVAPADAVPTDAAPADAAVPAADEVPAAVVEAPPPPPPPPEPPAPETFAFATSAVSVAESQAGAAIVIRRSGGTLGQSSVIWRTTDGTAREGSDYADLGAIVERFAAGERTRTIHIPIVGDAAPEGVESFFVDLATSEPGAAPTPEQRVEVTIEDDD